MKSKTFFAILLFFVLTLIEHAHLIAGSGGSAYSRYGVGEVRYFPSDRSVGKGGATIALLGTNTVSTINPAAWTQLARTRFSLGVTYEGFSSKDGSGSSFLSGANFNGIVFAVPVSRVNGIVISAGLTPYSMVNYTVVDDVTNANPPYTLTHTGKGGLSNAHLGISFARGKDWHFGAKLNYLFGTLKHKTSQTFSSADYTTAELSRETKMNGIGATIGLIYSGAGTLLNLEESQNLSFGVVFSTGAQLTTTRENLYQYSAGATVIGRDTIAAGEGRSFVPFAFGFGISFTSKEQFVLAGDLYYQNWNKGTILDVHPTELRDSYRIGVGGEFLPHKELSAEFLQKVAYRFGVFYHASNLLVAGKGIDEIGVTGGVGLPMFIDTRFSVGIEYSIRGTTANNLQRDNIIRVTFTLNGGELWFVRPEEE